MWHNICICRKHVQEDSLPSVRRCPLLGLKDDEHTRLSFASESHACYRTGKAKAISVDHQRQFCLEKEHISCPIFLNAGVQGVKSAKKIPVRVQKPEGSLQPILAENSKLGIHEDEAPEKSFISSLASKRYASLWEVAGVIIFLMLVLVGWWLFNNRDLFFPNQTPVQASIVKTSSPSPTATNIEAFFPNSEMVAELTAHPLVTDESGALISLLPTKSSTPTASATSTKTAIATPSATASAMPLVCSPPYGWVNYTVRFGESLAYFANYFNVSVDTLLTANCLENSFITAGQNLFLPWTPFPPTRTPTRTSTNTSEPGNPLSTQTPTATWTRTSTPSNTATFTSIPPTSTELPTATQIPPTATGTDQPDPTQTGTPTPILELPLMNTPSNTFVNNKS